MEHNNKQPENTQYLLKEAKRLIRQLRGENKKRLNAISQAIIETGKIGNDNTKDDTVRERSRKGCIKCLQHFK